MGELPGPPHEFEAELATYSSLVESMIVEAEQYSFQEYMGYALREAIWAAQHKNYGIGAAYALRSKGEEVVMKGSNGIVSRRDTGLHAEWDAMNVIESVARNESVYSDRILFIRQAPPGKPEGRMIATTAEPCMTCAGRMVTGGINEVLVGAPEVDGGVFKKNLKLPPLWKTGISRFKIVNQNTSNPSSEGYVNPRFAGLALGIMNIRRAELNKEITERNGLVDLSDVIENARRLLQLKAQQLRTD